MINYGRDHTVADGLNYVATWQTGMFQGFDMMEAFAAQADKRDPEYQDLLPEPGFDSARSGLLGTAPVDDGLAPLGDLLGAHRLPGQAAARRASISQPSATVVATTCW